MPDEPTAGELRDRAEHEAALARFGGVMPAGTARWGTRKDRGGNGQCKPPAPQLRVFNRNVRTSQLRAFMPKWV